MKSINSSTITKSALFVALLCVSGFLVLPIPFTPIVLSLHTVVVNCVALLFKPKQAFTIVGIYLFMGFIGLPVFSAGTAGAEKLFGPTGGFYFGFLFSVFFMSLCLGKEIRFSKFLFVTLCIGLPIQHSFAILFMCFYNGFSLWTAIISVSLPFLLGDIFKCFLSVSIAVNVFKRLNKNME